MNSEALYKNFPVLKVRNRTGAQQHVLYEDGDSVTFNGFATRPISSKGLLQIPDSNLFEMVSPTLFELRDRGVIDLKPPVQESAPEPKEDKKSSKDK